MVANFIEEALEEGGVVLVNCLMGVNQFFVRISWAFWWSQFTQVSRSATCVLAFLCLRRGMSIEQAVTTVNIFPFIKLHFCLLNKKIARIAKATSHKLPRMPVPSRPVPSHPSHQTRPSASRVDVVTGPRRDVVGILVLLYHFLYKPIKMLFTISKITPHTCVSKANF